MSLFMVSVGTDPKCNFKILFNFNLLRFLYRYIIFNYNDYVRSSKVITVYTIKYGTCNIKNIQHFVNLFDDYIFNIFWIMYEEISGFLRFAQNIDKYSFILQVYIINVFKWSKLNSINKVIPLMNMYDLSRNSF
jgi:hypothetical protein